LFVLGTIALVFILANPLRLVRLGSRRLPGMQIDLPRDQGDVGYTNYGRGRMVINTSARLATVVLVWSPGVLPSDEEIATAMASLAGPSDGPPPEAGTLTIPLPAGLEGRSFRVRTSDRPSQTVFSTVVLCGRRLITLSTGGPGRGVQGLHERMLATLRCEPDAAEEAMLQPRVATPNPFPWTSPRKPGFGYRGNNVQHALDPARSLLMPGAPRLQLRPPGTEATAK
jgi:hypothetical protein